MSKGPHTYNSGRIHRAGGTQPPAPAPAPAPQNTDDPYLPPPVRLKKRRRWPIVVLSVFMAVVLLLAAAVVVVWRVADDALTTGSMGSMASVVVDHSGGVVEMPPDPYTKSEVVHFLILGIDYEEGREYEKGMGQTDMILYIRYDLKNNKMNMLQVPRDSFVGDNYRTGGTGKINAMLISGEDKDNPINNIAIPFQAMFKLPVDFYLTIDMEALSQLVDAFGGLRVYVPRDMAYGGGSLPQGWQWLDGTSVEFFVRTRYGTGFERADIDRLDNQRHFYSALFRRFMNLSPFDVPNLLPVVKVYCNTNLEVGDLVSIGISALSLEAENVMFCKVPGATGQGLDPRGPDAEGRERSLYVIDLYGRGEVRDEEGNLGENPGLAALLNEYFRTPGTVVPAEDLLLPQQKIPASIALYPPNIQGMGDVQEGEGGAGVDVEPGWDEDGNFTGEQ